VKNYTAEKAEEISTIPAATIRRLAKEFAEKEFEKYKVIQDREYKSDFDKLINTKIKLDKKYG